MHGDNAEGDFIALDKARDRLIVRNVELPTSERSVPLLAEGSGVSHLSCIDGWAVVGAGGSYSRIQI